MHETPFISSSTQNLQSSTNEGDTFNIPNNRFDCIITRTSTLPTRDKKERPKSEVYNGFSSLRAARLANGERVYSQKESKKVVRSRSLHAPKKPPRDFSMRPMSTSPSGDIKEDSPAVPKLTSTITPTRPAPPAPFATFSKRSQTGQNPKLTDGSLQMEERRAKSKRNRSKSTSTVNESQNPRTKVAIPRGQSFNLHGTRQLIKTTPDENVVILTRTSSIDEGYETNVNLKSFGSKVSKQTGISSNSNEFAKEVSNSTSLDKCVEGLTENGDCGDKQVANGVSLSDAIQANAVYTRLQQKKEQSSNRMPFDPLSDNDGVSFDSHVHDAVSSGTGLTNEKDQDVNEKALNQVKRERGIEAHREVQRNERRQYYNKNMDIEKQKNESNSLHKVLETNPMPKVPHLANEDIRKPVATVADVFVENTTIDSQNNANTQKSATLGSQSFDSTHRRGPPPTVKPKPKVPKRPSMEKVVLQTVDNVEDSREVNTTATNATDKFLSCDMNLGFCSVKSKKDHQLREEESSGTLINQGRCDTSVNLGPNADEKSKDEKYSEEEDCSGERFVEKDIGLNLKSSVEQNAMDQSPIEDDVFQLVNSTQQRSKSESEAESAGSVDSLTSLTSQVTVILNPEARTPLHSSNKVVQGPFESHPNNRRRKPIPEPYSSHPERRPKPAKALPSTSTVKSKTRKSKSVYGRRINSSPPSTPPPPPKIETSESTPPAESGKARPPVPPRAPSMHIHNNNTSVDHSNIFKAPPPRPLKPPTVTAATNFNMKKGFDMTDSPNTAKSPPSEPSPVQSDAQRDTPIQSKCREGSPVQCLSEKGYSVQSNSGVKGEENSKEFASSFSNGHSKHKSTTKLLGDIDLRPQSTNREQSSKEFSRKLEYFKESIDDKRKRKDKLFKQRSLDSCQEKVRSTQIENSSSNEVQLRKEGEEALRIISQLRKENGDILVNRKKSPAPQKPKRPSSVNMDNVVIFDVNEMNHVDNGLSSTGFKLSNRTPPPKPERTSSTRKSDIIERKEVPSVEDIKMGEKNSEPGETLPDFELRSSDAVLCETLKPSSEKKTVPKKPVRTSSLKRKDHSSMKIEVKKGPVVSFLNGKSPTNETKDVGHNVDSKNDTDTVEEVNCKFDSLLKNSVTSNGSSLASLNKILENDEDRSELKTVKEVVEEFVEVSTSCNSKVCLPVALSGDQNSSISETLSTQIDQLDRILLETSAVLSERLSDSPCSRKDLLDENLPTLKKENEDIRTFNDECVDCSSPNALHDVANDRSQFFHVEPECSPCTNDMNLKDHNKEKIVNEKEDSLASIPYSTKPFCDVKNVGQERLGALSAQNIHQSEDGNISVSLGKDFSQLEPHGDSCNCELSEPNGPKSVEKAINTHATENENHSYLPQTVSDEAEKPLFKRANSAPEIPGSSYLPRRKSRPPIPSILREKEADDRHDTGSDIKLIPNTRQFSKSQDCGIKSNNYMVENEKLLSLKDPKQDDQSLLSEKPAALAIYPFVAGNENELSFDSGDTIELLSRKSENVLVGRCNGVEGDFPASCVAVIRPLDDKRNHGEAEESLIVANEEKVENYLDFHEKECTCIAVADYHGSSDGDLSFKCGQEIHILSQVNQDWLKGSIQDRIGKFPRIFVKIHN